MLNSTDDTSLLINAVDHSSLISIDEESLCYADEWFRRNILILNDNETKTVMFTTRHAGLDKLQEIKRINIPLELENGTKFLGQHIDSTLSSSSHIDNVCRKLNSFGFW
ncbi:hypothetical protein JTB14_004496 [Gonioctena quinquepunctata]|nr:hypothetical protein JTB14_004496 [Gonioctena quinquepunctata]